MNDTSLRNSFRCLSIQFFKPKERQGTTMNRFYRILIIAAAIVSFGAASTLINSHQAVAQNPKPGSAPVNIVDPLPLPVTVVGIDNGTSPVLVRDVDNAARRPFQTSLCTSLGASSVCGTTPGSVTVSPSNRMVVEYVSIKLFCSSCRRG